MFMNFLPRCHNMHKDQKGPLKMILQIWPKILKKSKIQKS